MININFYMQGWMNVSTNAWFYVYMTCYNFLFNIDLYENANENYFRSHLVCLLFLTSLDMWK